MVRTGVSFIHPRVSEESLREFVLSYSNPAVACIEATNGSPGKKHKKDQVNTARSYIHQLAGDDVFVVRGLARIKNPEMGGDGYDFLVHFPEYDERLFIQALNAIQTYPASPEFCGRKHELSPKNLDVVRLVENVSRTLKIPSKVFYENVHGSVEKHESLLRRSGGSSTQLKTADDFAAALYNARGLLLEFLTAEYITRELDDGVIAIRRHFRFGDSVSDIDVLVMSSYGGLRNLCERLHAYDDTQKGSGRLKLVQNF